MRIGHNGIRHSGIRHNGIRHNGIRHNRNRHNGNRHNGIMYNIVLVKFVITNSVVSKSFFHPALKFEPQNHVKRKLSQFKTRFMNNGKKSFSYCSVRFYVKKETNIPKILCGTKRLGKRFFSQIPLFR